MAWFEIFLKWDIYISSLPTKLFLMIGLVYYTLCHLISKQLFFLQNESSFFFIYRNNWELLFLIQICFFVFAHTHILPLSLKFILSTTCPKWEVSGAHWGPNHKGIFIFVISYKRLYFLNIRRLWKCIYSCIPRSTLKWKKCLCSFFSFFIIFIEVVIHCSLIKLI